MTINESLSSFWDSIAPHITKDYLLNIWDIAKIILVIVAVLLLIRLIIRLKFFKRIKLILRNLVEINNKMSKLIEVLDDQIIVVDEDKNKKRSHH